ncbi:cytochrome P450 [Amycolatopsis jiangsuensis]|uniref:Cytochrome P450 n=1 Tax=Amycolatopsis jiangsuensis TaxID=1181879 RepID=A0A840J821_9PSEU|nr:cytochrome P450 [Amycolatopsis jiangsuensis]MBB4689572.1 cytochrome P450 [Amycolatopsis jiangsuensis]
MASPGDFTDFDHHSNTYENVWSRYEKMRDTCPVAHSDQHGGFWVLTRYDDVKKAARDTEAFSSAQGVRVPNIGGGQSIPLDTDPPVHTEYRRLFTQALTPDRVRELRPFLRGCVDELVDAFFAQGGGDAIADIAVLLPLRVLTEVIGFSEQTVAQLPALTTASWTKIATMSLHEARAEIRNLVEAEIERHRSGDVVDELSRLLDAEVDGRPIEHDELVRVLQSFATAGHETTTNALGGVIHTLAADPALQDLLRAEPELIPGFVEECLRVRSPAQQLGRVTTCEVEIGGRTIPEGERVLLSFAAANHDSSRFAEPDRVDLGRSARGHLAFGWGVHQCVGAALARQELVLLVEKLCALPRIGLAATPESGTTQGGIHLGLRTLPIEFEPVSAGTDR